MLPLVLCLLLGERTHTPTVEDYFTLVTPGEIALSPDGKELAFLQVAWGDDKDTRVTTLQVADVATGKVRKLATGKVTPRAIRWSKDGKAIFYLASVEKKGTQVWRITADAVEADRMPLRPITTVEGGLRAFDLSPDEKVIYALTDEPLVDPTFAELRKQFSNLEYGTSGKKVSSLWRIERDTGKVEKLLDGRFYGTDFAVSPDGQRIAFITAPDDSVAAGEGRSGVAILDLKTKDLANVPDGPFRAESASKTGWLEKLAWSPSSKVLAFNAAYDGQPAEIMLVEGFGDKLVTTKLDRPVLDGRPLQVHGYGSPLAWRDEGELCLLCDDHARSVAFSVREIAGGKAKSWTRLTPGDVVIRTFSLAGKKMAYILGTPTRFDDLYVQEGAGEVRSLTTLNPQVETWQIPTAKIVKWKAKDGTDVEGILELPPDYKEGQRVPLVVNIHGGPTTCANYALHFSPYDPGVYLTSKGYAVLSPNYRGSTGYGDTFVLALNGHENDVEVGDIIAGAEAMVNAGVADPDRLAIMGWSNGGYLTNCTITKTTMFKAAISGAGIIDHVMEWGISDEPSYPMVFKQGKTPWQARDIWLSASPLWGLGNVKTPTLIHVGGSDERCPPGHSKLLYRALKDYLNVPTELIVYPGEPHGLAKGKNRKAKMAWDLAWLDKYLKP
jgi:dipeptidyl aminopeptidase/acylaminoacyl peptidase